MIKINKRAAFTLAEMMIVMLVLSIIMAASMPILTKRTATSSSGKPLWKQIASAPARIYYGTNDDQRVLIGTRDRNHARALLSINRAAASGMAQISLSEGGTEGLYISANSSKNVTIGDDQTTIHIRGRLVVDGATTLNNTLGVSGATTLSGATSVNNSLRANSLTVTGQSSLQGLTAGTTSTGTTSTGALTANSIRDNGALVVAGYSTLQGASSTELTAGCIQNNGWLTVNGASTFQSTSRFNQRVYMAGISNATVSGSDQKNMYFINSSPVAGTHVGGNTPYYSFTYLSDRKFKELQGEFSPEALQKLHQLKVYNYKLNAKKIMELNSKKLDKEYAKLYEEEYSQRIKNNPEKKSKKLIAAEVKKDLDKQKEARYEQIKEDSMKQCKEHYVGVMAQDLQKVFPNSVITDEFGTLYIKNKDEMFYAMLNAIKSLDETVKNIIARLETLERLTKETQMREKTYNSRFNSAEQEISKLKAENKQIIRRLERLERQK